MLKVAGYALNCDEALTFNEEALIKSDSDALNDNGGCVEGAIWVC